MKSLRTVCKYSTWSAIVLASPENGSATNSLTLTISGALACFSASSRNHRKMDLSSCQNDDLDPNTFSTRRVVLFVRARLDNGSRSSFTKSNHCTPRSWPTVFSIFFYFWYFTAKERLEQICPKPQYGWCWFSKVPIFTHVAMGESVCVPKR